MKRYFGLALAGMILGLAATSSAASAAPGKDDKKGDNAKKIVAKWEVTKSGSDLPTGTTIEFTKDGKLVAIIKGDNTKLEGSYKVDKEKLIVKLKVGDQTVEESVTITKLTDTELVVKDKDNKVDEFKKTK